MKKLLTALFSFALLIGLVSPVQAAGSATLDLTPLTASKSVDNLFSVEIHVNTAGEAVNTIKAYLTFDPNVLEVTSVSTSGSIATIFTENEPDNLNGTIHITGAASGAGYTGTNGLFATINFRAKASGTSTLTFTSESRIISNGDNSDILNFTGLQNGSYTIGAGSTTVSSGGGDDPSASGAALPESGVATSTVTMIGLAMVLILGGLFIANPYLFSPKLAKRNQIKNILKKL
jgi:hypothetical protein